MMVGEATTTTLGDLCDLISEHTDPMAAPHRLYVGLEHLAPGRLRRIAGGRAGDVRSAKAVFRKDDVLYGKLRPYLNKAVLADSDGFCTTELLVLRAKASVEARFLACVVHDLEFVEHAMSGVTGAHHPRTSWHHIRRFALPDFTRDEQRQIAAVLWRTQDLIAASEATAQAAVRLKATAMRELFTRGLRGEKQKETEAGRLPESWGHVSLGALGRIGNGSTPRKSVRAYWDQGVFPWLTSAKVYDRDILSADQFVSAQALADCHLPRLEPGTVLIAITGQGKTLGHCAVLRIPATINQHIAYFAPTSECTDPSFLRSFLETKYEYLRQVASAGGSTKGALTCGFLRRLQVPLPTIEEQREIVMILEAVERKIDLHRRKRAVLEELFTALLHKLVTGEIRVEDLDLSALENASKGVVAA